MSAKSDMVANPVLRISKAKIVSLKKGKTYVENVDDWERSLKNTLSASALEFFLEPESGIQVPDDQADSVWLQELCNQQVFANRTSLAKQEKVNGQVHIKEEPMTPLTTSKLSEGPMTPKPPETEPSGKSFERKDATSSSGNRLSKYEENVKKNSMKLAKMKMARMKAETGGKIKVTLFCNPMTMVDPHEVDEVNPKANVRVVESDPHNPFGEVKIFELEDTATRANRLSVWEVLYASVKPVVDQGLLCTVAVGNCYHLFTLVKNHLRSDRKEIVVGKISKKLKELKKLPSELFVSFRAKYDGIVNEMRKWDYVKDEVEMKGILEDALNAECELTKQVYVSVCTAHGTKLDADALLDMMEPLMEQNERKKEAERVKQKAEHTH